MFFRKSLTDILGSFNKTIVQLEALSTDNLMQAQQNEDLAKAQLELADNLRKEASDANSIKANILKMLTPEA